MELDSKFEKLVKGQLQYQSANLGCNLLIARLKRKYAENSTEEVLQGCVQEFKTFLTKYKAISENDIEQISKL